MDNYDITIQLQLIDEKEGYQADYPYWRLRIIHWLMHVMGFFLTHLFTAQFKKGHHM